MIPTLFCAVAGVSKFDLNVALLEIDWSTEDVFENANKLLKEASEPELPPEANEPELLPEASDLELHPQ